MPRLLPRGHQPYACQRHSKWRGQRFLFKTPNVRGEVEARSQPVTNANEMLTCLVSGKTVYGLTLQNTNVRIAPQTNACRVGRIPRGTVVHITDSLAISSSLPVSTSKANSASANPLTLQTIGYVEDIQPLFLRSCNTCHSNIVKNMGLQVTDYAALLKGSQKRAVIVPGDPNASVLWQKVSTGEMPLLGKLSAPEKTLIHDRIQLGAPKKRSPAPPSAQPGEPRSGSPSRTKMSPRCPMFAPIKWLHPRS